MKQILELLKSGITIEEAIAYALARRAEARANALAFPLNENLGG